MEIAKEILRNPQQLNNQQSESGHYKVGERFGESDEREESRVMRDKESRVMRDEESRVMRDKESRVMRDEESRVMRDEESRVMRDEESRVMRDKESRVMRSLCFYSPKKGEQTKKIGEREGDEISEKKEEEKREDEEIVEVRILEKGTEKEEIEKKKEEERMKEEEALFIVQQNSIEDDEGEEGEEGEGIAFGFEDQIKRKEQTESSLEVLEKEHEKLKTPQSKVSESKVKKSEEGTILKIIIHSEESSQETTTLITEKKERKEIEKLKTSESFSINLVDSPPHKKHQKITLQNSIQNNKKQKKPSFE